MDCNKQVIVYDTTPNNLVRIFNGHLSARSVAMDNRNDYLVNTRVGPLQISVGGWMNPRKNGVTRIFAVLLPDKKVDPFVRAKNVLAPFFMPGDKLVVYQNDDKTKGVEPYCEWCWVNYTRVTQDLRNLDLDFFMNHLCNAIQLDTRPVLAPEYFKQ